MNLIIKPLGIEDANALSELAIKAYYDHYPHFWYDGGNWYVDKCFTISQLESEISDKNNLFYFAIYENEAVGFLKLRPHNQLENQTGDGFELERIYLLKKATNKGIGEKLMDFAIEKAKKQQKDYIWLKTMDSSRAAINFYQKQGFEICGTAKLDFEMMKTELRGMYILKKEL